MVKLWNQGSGRSITAAFAAMIATLVWTAPAVARGPVSVEPRPGTVLVDATTLHSAGASNDEQVGGLEPDFWGPGVAGVSWSDQQTGATSAVSSYRMPAEAWPFLGGGLDEEGTGCVGREGDFDCSTSAWDAAAFASVDLGSGELKAYTMSAMRIGGGDAGFTFGDADSHATVRVYDTITLSEPATITLAGGVDGTLQAFDGLADDLGYTPWGTESSLAFAMAFHRDNPDWEPFNEDTPFLIREGGVGRSYDAPIASCLLCGGPLEVSESYSVDIPLAAGTHYFTLVLRSAARTDTYGTSDFAHTVETETDFDSTLTFRIEAPAGVTITSGSGLLPIVGEASADTTPPAISCDAASAGWHGEDVTIACTAGDDASGLADPADANFSLSTAVTKGVETEAASTDSHEVCDLAENCATAGPVSGIKVDRKAPMTRYQGNTGTYMLDQTVEIRCVAEDGGSGVESDTCADATGPAYTFGAGTTTLSATAVDAVGNVGTAQAVFTVEVTYDGLAWVVGELVGKAGVARALNGKLAAAKVSADRGNSSAKAGQLGAFENHVRAQSGKAIAADDAELLIQFARLL